MNSLSMLISGLQALSAWLLAILALLALTVSAIVCLLFVELILERGALAQAYTVKTNSAGESASFARNSVTR
jgi:hypothetical protein